MWTDSIKTARKIWGSSDDVFGLPDREPFFLREATNQTTKKRSKRSAHTRARTQARRAARVPVR
jgi:hypothetical protein